MNNDYSPDLITLVDDEGAEHNFEILDTLEYEDVLYYALIPVFEHPEDSLADSGEYYIMEVIEENGEQELAEVDDDLLIDKLAEIFESRFNDIFAEDEEEE